MKPMVGLEPTALDLQGRRSTTELHRHKNSIAQWVKIPRGAEGSETNSPHWSEDARLITNHREVFLAHVSPSYACSGSHSCGASIIPYSLRETIFPLWNRTTDAPSKPARVPAKVHSNTHSKKQTSPVT